jgi:hypothetical protein
MHTLFIKKPDLDELRWDINLFLEAFYGTFVTTMLQRTGNADKRENDMEMRVLNKTTRKAAPRQNIRDGVS